MHERVNICNGGGGVREIGPKPPTIYPYSQESGIPVPKNPVAHKSYFRRQMELCINDTYVLK